MTSSAAGLDGVDLVDHVLAFDDLAEHGIAPAVLARVVQEVVVLGVDEELGRGRVRGHGAGHRHRVLVVLQAVLGFVLDGLLGRLLLHVGSKPPPWIMKSLITRWKIVLS
jgi:hypothetical protein